MQGTSSRVHLSLAAAAAAFAVLTSVALPAGGAEGGNEEDAARELFVQTHRCSTCHSVAAAGIDRKSDKIVGVDLGGFVTDEPDRLSAYLRKEEARDGEDHKKTFKGTDEELQAILDWLGSLEAATESD